MTVSINKWKLAVLFCLVLGSLALSGCATTDTDNISEMPWNTPKTWESGLPSTLNEGR
jgi:hypothetical protein